MKVQKVIQYVFRSLFQVKNSVKVLLTSASFASHYGGPAYSVRSLATQLSSTGITVAIWAPDGSARSQPLLDLKPASGNIQLHELTGSLTAAIAKFGVPDIFHDSGLWLRHNYQIFATAISNSKPLLISTRGMLEPAALKYRRWKKCVAWNIYQKRILQGASALHVTSSLEASSVSALGLRPEVVCIANGLPVSFERPMLRAPGPKKVLFLGRIHPIKGLPMLIEAWSRIRPLDWILEIAGPDEVNHRESLEKCAKALSVQQSVHFTGRVDGEAKKELFSRAAVFVLPSHSENFGLAAGEALAAGLPVIATTGTPWQALESERCGWYVDTSVDGLEAGLRAALATPLDELQAMGLRGHSFVARSYSWVAVAEKMKLLYGRIVATR